MASPARLALLPALLVALAGCRLFTATASLVIENGSSAAIVEVYLPPNGLEDLGDDLLGDPIPPGDSRIFRWIAPGLYDIVAWDADGGWRCWYAEQILPWERHVVVYAP